MAMNQARVGLLVAAALIATPLAALAQPAQPKKAQPTNKAKPADKGKPPDKGPPPPKTEEKEINLDEPAAGADVKAAGDASTPVEGEGLGDICKIDPTACPSIDMDKAAARDINAQMYAVQQIYALRYHRFEVNPFFGVTMNDQFVSHPGPGLALNWYITNVLAIGVSGNVYAGLNSPSSFNFETSRAARVAEPATEYQWNANGNFTYVPAYGKFAGFSNFIFHYDFYVVGGLGAISTRPISVVDPDNRTFQFVPHVDFHVGGGLRIFFNRWFAATLEISDYIFFDQLENTTIAPTTLGDCGKPADECPDTWLGGTSFTNNVQAQVGLSIFLPFSWEYRLPK
jgi:outer membrane beta-barrel protein